jgi:hypothetical protein
VSLQTEGHEITPSTGLTPDEAKKFTQLREMRDEGPGCSENEDIITYDDIAQGNVRVEISHAGGEMEALVADLNTTVNGERCVFVLSGV